MMIPAIVAAPSGGVLVASPSSSLREQVRDSFYEHRWPVQEVMGGADALLKLETGNWQLLYLDRRLPDLDVEELIQIIKQRFPGIAVVMVDSDSGPVPPDCDGLARERQAAAIGPTLAEMATGQSLMRGGKIRPPKSSPCLE